MELANLVLIIVLDYRVYELTHVANQIWIRQYNVVHQTNAFLH